MDCGINKVYKQKREINMEIEKKPKYLKYEYDNDRNCHELQIPCTRGFMKQAKKQSTLNKVDHFILGQYLSEYDEKLSFDDILDLIRQDSQDIIVCENYEDFSKDSLIEEIKNLQFATVNLLMSLSLENN